MKIKKPHDPLREFGGSLLKGRRKSRRPLHFDEPIHMVLKADNADALLKNKDRVENIIRDTSRKFKIQILSLGIHADHVHIAVTSPNREAHSSWSRAVTGRLSQQIPNLKWKMRPFTKIGRWGEDLQRLQNYIQRNEREGQFILNSNLRVERFAEQCYAGFRSLEV